MSEGQHGMPGPRSTYSQPAGTVWSLSSWSGDDHVIVFILLDGHVGDRRRAFDLVLGDLAPFEVNSPMDTFARRIA